MSTKNKTLETEEHYLDFLNRFVENESKKQESLKLIKMMQNWSGFEPKIWGNSMIGFGSYHYKYTSGHEGDMFLIGFSPRKIEFSLYVLALGNQNNPVFLDKLGKFKMGKACIYFKKLGDLNLDVLKDLCQETIKFLKKNY